MKKEDLIHYAATENWIIEQANKLFKIAQKEYPEQFGSFIIDDAHFYDVEIDEDEITFSFEEGRGDWFERHYFNMPIETFLDENLFREQQRKRKIRWKEDVIAEEKRKADAQRAKELGLLEELKKKYGNKKS